MIRGHTRRLQRIPPSDRMTDFSSLRNPLCTLAGLLRPQTNPPQIQLRSLSMPASVPKHQRLVMMGIALLFAVICGGFAVGMAAPPAQPLRVLFVGNSYTYGGNLPKVVQAMSEADPLGRTLAVDSVTTAGFQLAGHWKRTNARAKIAEARWDVVVLQDHSTQTLERPELFHQYMGLFAAEVQAAGARPFVFMTWARQATPERQAIITAAYEQAAAANRATVVPVGLAWQTALADAETSVTLHVSDGSHPGKLGVYLNACMFYGALTGEDPTALPNVIRDQSGKVLSEIPAREGAFLRRVAARTLQTYKQP